MDTLAESAAPPVVVQLINSPTMRFGALTIDPPHRRIVHDDGREIFLEPRVMQVLVAFGRTPGAILSRESLIASCWEGRFVSDDAVNRVISRLRRVSQEIGAGCFVLKTINKVGFRLIVSSTADEADASTPQTDSAQATRLKSPTQAMVEQPPVGAAPATAPRRKAVVKRLSTFLGRPIALVRTITGAFVCAVVLALLVSAVIWRGAQKAISVPELRLETLAGPSPADAPGVVQALQGELTAALGRSADLQLFTEGSKVLPSPSAFQLGGSVQALGPTLRFAFTLRSGEHGRVIWSSVIDGPVAQAIAAPHGVANRVSFTVRCILYGAADYPGQLSPAAVLDYARFCDEVATGESRGAISRRTEDLRQAVAEAPDFAEGWAELAQSIAEGLAYPHPLWDIGTRKEAEDAAARALQLVPSNSMAHYAKNLLISLSDFADREDELRLAVRGADRFGGFHANYARFLLTVGRTKEAARVAEQGFDIDSTGEAVIRLIQASYAMNEAREAESLASGVKETRGEDPRLTLYAVWAAVWDGRHQAALKSLLSGQYDNSLHDVRFDVGATATVADGDAQVFKALDSGSATDRAKAVALMTHLAANPRTIDPFVPLALAALGRDREALAAAEPMLKDWRTTNNFLLFTPVFAKARRLPEFTALADRLGLLRYWRVPGRAPDFCAEAAPPPLCRILH